MKRIHWHWTAGNNKASSVDRKHYHFIIEGDGNVVVGDNPVSANKSPIQGAYAAHTLNANSDAIAIALCGMHGAKEKPFKTGNYPITDAQVTALANLTAKLCSEYNIPVARETTLSHAEVQPTLKIKQRGKWDIAWLPGMRTPGNPVTVGDDLRKKVAQRMPPVKATPKPPQGFLAALMAILTQLFGRK